VIGKYIPTGMHPYSPTKKQDAPAEPMTDYKQPFPWFGGKRAIAHEVWRRFGNVPNYVEPFFGGGSMLFMRPTAPKIETVNDKDKFVANFWRALMHDPAGVAKWADWPVNEADLHARHWWLVNQRGFTEKMSTEPEYFDVKIAGWWVWGICQWIGSGWCEGVVASQLPHLGDSGMGIHRPQMPALSAAGRGVLRPSPQLPDVGNTGRGVRRAQSHLKRPHLMSSKGINRTSMTDLQDYLSALAARLRRVRVCCGDWARVLGPSPTTKLGITAVFLDPPYSAEANRAEVYAVEDFSVAHEVRRWALENGDNPELRIALCGYEGEHAMPDTWEVLEWKARGGYGSQNKAGNENARRERIWFSPHCLQVHKPKQMDMFAA
jgi:site-specific DNA-adenine methylase